MVTHLVRTIKSRARELGMTDTELARRAGITKSSLSRLGKQHGARVETIQNLADVVGLTLTLSPKNDHARAAIEGTLFDVSKWKP